LVVLVVLLVMLIMVFWVVVLCSHVGACHHFGEILPSSCRTSSWKELTSSLSFLNVHARTWLWAVMGISMWWIVFYFMGHTGTSRAWDNIRENINILAQESLGYCEPKHCGLMRDVQNWLIEGSRLNYSGCRTQVKRMKGIWVI
jgi:hypothetical protein